MLVEDVIKCSFSHWYPIFSHVSIPSTIIKIDDKFKEYILSDGIILPECCNLEVLSQTQNENQFTTDEDNDEEEGILVEFPLIEKQIRRCLSEFKFVFPKLNWSSCEDSSWINTTGTKCSDLTGIFLLIKSSDKIVHDLTNPFEYCTDYDPIHPPNIQYELILRKWIDINPSMEFRCFIANNHIIGISQRDVRSYYEYIGKEKNQICDDIKNFFNEFIIEKFPLSNYIIDILRPESETITLIDINAFGDLTDSLLFDWDELNQKANELDPTYEDSLDFRYIKDRFSVQPSRFKYNSVPLDVLTGSILNIYDQDSVVNP